MFVFQLGSHSRRCQLDRAQKQAYKTVSRHGFRRLPGVLHLVPPADCHEAGCVNCECRVPSPIEASFLTIDEYCSFIIHSTKVKENRFTRPG
jgi:hypothetical protein